MEIVQAPPPGSISGGIWRNTAEFTGFRRCSVEFRHVFAGAVRVLWRSMEPTASVTVPAPPPNNAVPRVGVFRQFCVDLSVSELSASHEYDI
jgi:hypothetical protein